MMVPLRLEWHLSAPITGLSRPLHLDALVARAITEEAIANGFTGNILEPALTLPLDKAMKGGAWCWKASALLSQKNREHAMRHWTRRTDEVDYSLRAAAGQFKDFSKAVVAKPYGGQIDTGSGMMRNHYQHIPIRSIEHFVAYCIGDEDRLLELLHPDAGWIKSIGPRGREGFGKIRADGFAIVQDEQALEFWTKRVMPWKEPGMELVQAAHRPPYWSIDNLTDSYVAADVFC